MTAQHSKEVEGLNSSDNAGLADRDNDPYGGLAQDFTTRTIGRLGLYLSYCRAAKISAFHDDDYAGDKTYEPRLLEGESSSDETDEEKHGHIWNGKTILDHSLPSKYLEHFFVLALETAEARALAASLPTNKNILTDDDCCENSPALNVSGVE
ncbi:hypothetical protein TNCV_1196811 [Trichonephila clavipes]|uniref:Uncharacterized protein n=1 Tax=Trichonephila clavipes TaxID=2585209 RepID=A0A8X6S172_TRICX|nr:hypothetical protein TNCV_1196811 [Trichonephila clavipes]